ncbi:FecR family protein [Chitinophaga sp. 22321]|uniref:FecR family protein n=1 Tax=Chitinophaga hostae TaxID=2831022 RepID=A0ABS5IXJ6_9BACT|nr:FecR family protein [Chitinophaga hostae]MBS0027680.1 FecR family protein [Chitinophaga hostae]
MEKSIKLLFSKYLLDRCSNEEIMELLDYFKISDNDHILKQFIYQELENESIEAYGVKDVEANLEIVYANVLSEIHQRQNPKPGKIVYFWSRIAAAVVILFVSTIVYYYLTGGNSKSEKSKIAETSYQKKSAVLILANGERISLSNPDNKGRIKEAGVIISQTTDGQITYEITDAEKAGNKINTLSTPPGVTYNIVLPDGSKVTLNAASSLSYPVCFNASKNRWVELVGEAFFEIERDSRQPFLVKTDKQEIAVLGTQFNVDCYFDDSVGKTTLFEGSVGVRSLSFNSGDICSEQAVTILRPGQQGSSSKGGCIEVSKANLESITAWKNNEIMFDSEKIETIMKQVSRWYDVEVIYNGKKSDEKYSGSVSRSYTLSNVLQILEASGKVHFKIEGRRVYVSN